MEKKIQDLDKISKEDFSSSSAAYQLLVKQANEEFYNELIDKLHYKSCLKIWD